MSLPSIKTLAVIVSKIQPGQHIPAVCPIEGTPDYTPTQSDTMGEKQYPKAFSGFGLKTK